MTNICKSFFVAAVAAALLVPAAAVAESQKPRIKIKVHPSRHWHGYGFLPGYRPSLAESQGVPILGREPHRPEPRYLNLYNGQWAYGWGGPGFYRGRYNGGSFGPCWTYTPIGMMPTCGQ